MAVKETPPAVEVVETREAGFHVMLGGNTLGCFTSAEAAEQFADAHPRATGHEVTVVEVAG